LTTDVLALAVWRLERSGIHPAFFFGRSIDTPLAFGKASDMSSTTEFIAELVRAANEVERLSKGERSHLLLRGFRMIREMRLENGVRPIREKDRLRTLEIEALRAENGTGDDAKVVLLETASLMRELKNAMDAKDKVLKEE
jgi:hypothetical protein